MTTEKRIMEGVWFLGEKKDLSFRSDINEPQISKPDEVKVKVAYSGICGSDIHYMQGEMGDMSPKHDGVVLGHEFSGTVVDLGEDAEKVLAVGDKVCVDPNSCCGECIWAKERKPNFCENNKAVGVKKHGGWANFCVVPLKNVYKVPNGVTLKQAALSEPYSCILRGWKNLGEMENKDARVMVQGAGIIGLLFCTVLHKSGFRNVTVCEINEGRRKSCSEMGLNFNVVHPKEVEMDLKDKKVDLYGFDYIIDCTGNTFAVQNAIGFARRGAKILIFGCCPAGRTMQLEPFQVFWKELTIIGSFINPYCFEETMPLIDDLSRGGYLDYDKLGIKIFSFEEYDEALQSLRTGTASKAVFLARH